MTLDEDVLKFGAKGAVLKYIRETDPSIRIEPFLLVPVGADWREYRSQIAEVTELGDCLVRSSSPVEDGKRVSFAGLFNTVKFEGDADPGYVLETVTDRDVLDYAKIHGIEGPIEMGLVFQRNSKSDMNWGILRHPHNPELLFVMGQGKNIFGSRYTDDFVYDENTGELLDVFNYYMAREDRIQDRQLPFDDLVKAIEVYKRIEAMPEFQTGYTYHMEFGTNPVSVYQFRPFRKKGTADWKFDSYDSHGYGEDETIFYSTNICFGITPPEGLKLTLARALSTDARKELISYGRSLIGKMPHDEVVKKLMDKGSLSEQERAYAEQIAGLDPNVIGSVDSEAFDKAVSELNRSAKKEETCLYQENMHHQFGRDIDIAFPNAKAYVPNMGFQFLTHRWFRAMQHYDIVLVGPNLHLKTGQEVRVFSDGLIGKISSRPLYS